jgi:hypothetical protein
MKKNKLIVLLVLLIAVVGLTMGSVTAKTTTKTKKITAKPLLKKWTYKKSGKYVLATKKEKYDSKNHVVVIMVGKKNKANKKYSAFKGGKYKSKLYFKLNGKKYSTKWAKGDLKKPNNYDYQAYLITKKAKVSKVVVKF